MTGNAAIMFQAVEDVLAQVIVVLPKPDDGEGGGDWWIGVDCEREDVNTPNGFWDASSSDKVVSDKCASDCRQAIAQLVQKRFRELLRQQGYK